MTNTPVTLDLVEDGFEFASMGGYGEAEAYLCRATGHIYYHSEMCDDFEELPDDIDDGDKYVALPHKNDLDLGRALVEQFVATHLNDAHDQVRTIFRRRGAYARFKDLLERRGKLQAWYDYEQEATHKALRAWCADNGIALAD